MQWHDSASLVAPRPQACQAGRGLAVVRWLAQAECRMLAWALEALRSLGLSDGQIRAGERGLSVPDRTTFAPRPGLRDCDNTAASGGEKAQEGGPALLAGRLAFVAVDWPSGSGSAGCCC